MAHLKFIEWYCASAVLGDRPYKCDTCAKEFNYLTTYKRHLNIHKGEKPFACEHCDKKFTRLNYLKNHLNTHAKHSSQESQTDFKFDGSNADATMDEDGQDRMAAMAEETVAAHSIRNESKNDVELDKEDEGELGSSTGKAQGVGIDRYKKGGLVKPTLGFVFPHPPTQSPTPPFLFLHAIVHSWPMGKFAEFDNQSRLT